MFLSKPHLIFLCIEGLNVKKVYYKSVPVPLVFANSDNVYWTEFWVGENTVGTFIGVLKNVEADVLLSADKLVLGCSETVLFSHAGPHHD